MLQLDNSVQNKLLQLDNSVQKKLLQLDNTVKNLPYNPYTGIN